MTITMERIEKVRADHRTAWAAVRKARRNGEPIPAGVARALMAAGDATAALFRDLEGWFDQPLPEESL